jgi:hypothetical protein
MWKDKKKKFNVQTKNNKMKIMRDKQGNCLFVEIECSRKNMERP